jgi:glycosyltransferase involved in cell wall biosynthesis
VRIALDATYSVGDQLSGVGVYSNEIIHGLAALFPQEGITLAYRPHRFLRSLREKLPANCRRRPLWDTSALRGAELFHGLNQRLPQHRYQHTVTTFHDLFVMTSEYSDVEFRRRFTLQAKQAAERSDLIVAVSRFTANQVRDLLGVEETRIRVIPHGVHRPENAPDGPREKLVLHVGAIQKRKNIARLAKAFEEMPPDWRLVLVGSCGFGSGEILRQIESSPARDRIEVPGYVSATMLADYYARAAIFAFPSLDEGFGIPILEAMAWGIPVLTSNRSALPEAGGDAALYVDPFSTEELASALRALARDEGLLKTLAARGSLRAADFPWERAVEQTAGVYRDLFA